MRAVLAGENVFGPVMIDGTTRQVHDFGRSRVDTRFACNIGKGHNGVGVRHIERVADERHAEGREKIFEEGCRSFSDTVAVRIAQQRDAVGCRRTRPCGTHDHACNPITKATCALAFGR